MNIKQRIGTGLVAVMLFSVAGATASRAEHTKAFKEKAGFDRPTKDIISTLRDNEVTPFTQFLDALNQGFSEDAVLRQKGPFTVFAPNDAAFKHMSTEDYKTLFGDKKKLKAMTGYHIVKGKLTAANLKKLKSAKTLQGSSVTLKQKDGDQYVNDVLVTTTDIPCANGVIHVINRVMLPPSSK